MICYFEHQTVVLIFIESFSPRLYNSLKAVRMPTPAPASGPPPPAPPSAASSAITLLASRLGSSKSELQMFFEVSGPWAFFQAINASPSLRRNSL